jgi:hypothetical protein
MEAGRIAYFNGAYNEQVAIEAAVEAGCEFYGDFQAPDKSLKTKARLITALRYYYEQWPLDEDLPPAPGGIEMSFNVELPILHPDTGRPLRYVGRFDCLAQDVQIGRYYINDEKTASRLGDTWINQWDMDAQMTGYIWGVQQTLGRPAEIVAQIRAVSILKYECGHAQVEIVRPQWQVDRWYEQMLRDVRRMVETYERFGPGSRMNLDHVDMAMSNVCYEYARSCDFMKLCKSPNPERLIEGNYEVVHWNPLVRA